MLLKNSSMRITELAEYFEMSLNAVSKHLKVLESSGLIKRTVEGRNHYCRAETETLKLAETWMQEYLNFWNLSLDSLEQYAKNKEKNNE